MTRSSAGRQLRTRARPAMSTPRNCCCSNFAQDQALSGRPKETDGLPHPRSLVTQRSERRSYRSRVLKGEEPICAAEILSRSCRLWVRHGHSAMSVQCPTCPKADGVARFSLAAAPGSRPDRCRAVIRPSRDPTRRTWPHGGGPHDGDGGSVSAPVVRLSIHCPTSCGDADSGARVHRLV